jgi:hypothetical protein
VIRDDDSASGDSGKIGRVRASDPPLIEYFRDKGRRLVEIDAGADRPQEWSEDLPGNRDVARGTEG